eukprot:TRINITY_DN23460_c0_g1_i2.p1 TRINITY_DN23460_c0_g1~~TRINITY_DN23460_c0_g1_i2.p1  ORF type:complete len:269 (-),score=51.95 TRINITY_DN23460_c0_g1_i2:233-1039(-)
MCIRDRWQSGLGLGEWESQQWSQQHTGTDAINRAQLDADLVSGIAHLQQALATNKLDLRNHAPVPDASRFQTRVERLQTTLHQSSSQVLADEAEADRFLMAPHRCSGIEAEANASIQHHRSSIVDPASSIQHHRSNIVDPVHRLQQERLDSGLLLGKDISSRFGSGERCNNLTGPSIQQQTGGSPNLNPRHQAGGAPGGFEPPAQLEVSAVPRAWFHDCNPGRMAQGKAGAQELTEHKAWFNKRPAVGFDGTVNPEAPEELLFDVGRT